MSAANAPGGARIGLAGEAVEARLHLAKIDGVGRRGAGGDIVQRRGPAAGIERHAAMRGIIVLHAVEGAEAESAV